MPFPPLSFADFGWFTVAFFRTFADPVGLSVPLVAGITFVIGVVSAFIHRRKYLLLTISPIPFALLASGLHKYPFLGRTVLFIVPSVLLLVAEGVSWLAHKSVLAGLALAACLFAQPVVNAAHTALAQDDTRADIKRPLGYVRDHWQQGDLLYVFYAAKRQFRY